MRASVLISTLSGIIILYVFVVFLSLQVNSAEKLKILLLLSIALGIHAIQHSTDELFYDFNPFVGKFELRDDPIKR
jgi:hypothetical protein